MGKIRIGMAGWQFEGWRGGFYPVGLKQKDELPFASQRVAAIEVNGTFYSMLRPKNYQSWSEQTPADFMFSLKAPKFITHQRRLVNFAEPLANFLASGPLALGEKLGPILWQFPPTLAFDEDLFAPFMAALPHSAASAAKLGQNHSDWMEGRTFLTPASNVPVRHAIEGRHASFKTQRFVELAREYGIAIVVGDTEGRWPYIEDVTADFVYIRLHGDETRYPTGYTKEALEHWGRRVELWAAGKQPADADVVVAGAPPPGARQVFAFFDNDTKETAPLNAVSLISHLVQRGILAPRSLPQVSVADVKPLRKVAEKKAVAAVDDPAKPKRVRQRPPSKKKTAAPAKRRGNQ